MCLYHSSHCQLPQAFDEATPTVLRVLSILPDGAPDISFDDQSSRNVLAYLHAEGFVAGPPWKFSVKGKENIACGAKIKDAQKVCKRAPVGTDIADMTLYELLEELDAHDFQFFLADARDSVRDAKKSPYEPPHSEKIWFARAGSKCNRYYLQALLRAEHGRPVPHFAKQDIYLALLGMQPIRKPDPRRRPAASSGAGGPCPDDFGDPKKARAARKKKVNKEESDGDGDGSEDEPGSEVDDSSGESSQDLSPDEGSEGD